MTRDGIEHDLYISPYKVKMGDYIFIFSSKFYMEKFKETIYDFTKELTLKINSRYGYEFKLKDFAKFVLYAKTEKRGYLIYNVKTKEYITKRDKFVFSVEKIEKGEL